MSDRLQDFCVASICREDLKEVNLSDEAIDSLTDEDMREIAAMMGDLYNNSGYWEDLQLCVARFLKRKEGKEDEYEWLE
jgi:hypothetical protein